MQPDLSLQISPPNSKPTSSSTWRKPSSDQEEEEEDEESSNLGFWRRRNLVDSNNNKPIINAHHAIDLSLSTSTSSLDPSNFLNIQTLTTNPSYNSHHHHIPFANVELGYNYMKPIRGIPVYHHNAMSMNMNMNPMYSSIPSQYHLCNHSPPNGFLSPHGFPRSRILPPKRSVRAPRMRWTTTLHARFVHAVELLGGHESRVFFFFFIFFFLLN